MHVFIGVSEFAIVARVVELSKIIIPFVFLPFTPLLLETE
jgi:hypothetical protein